MDKDTKQQIKGAIRGTEKSLTRSLLRWKYKKEGKGIPHEERLDQESDLVTDRAHEIIRRRGKTLWKQMKQAYGESRDQDGKRRK